MIRRTVIALAFVIVLLAVPRAQAQSGSVIDLQHANQLNGRVQNGEEVRELIGDVQFMQPMENGAPVQVWCDRALQFLAKNRIDLYGHVRVVRDSTTILAPSGTYDGATRRMEAHEGVRLLRGRTVLTARNGEYLPSVKRAHFLDQVVFVDSTSTIWSDELTYDERDGRSVAVGRAHAFESVNGVDVYGDTLLHVDSTRYSYATGNARLVRVDTSTNGELDTMVVASRRMHSYEDSVNRFVADEDVRIVRSDLAARCGTAIILSKQDRIRLNTRPIVWSAGNQITGDSMTVRMKDRRIQSLFVKGKAMAVSHADSLRLDRFHQLSGRQMTLYFTGHALERIVVERNATSLYYLSDESGPSGVNRASGDRITIDFSPGGADRIAVLGGVQGTHTPERLVAGHVVDQNLDGFRWYEQRPVRIGLAIVER